MLRIYKTVVREKRALRLAGGEHYSSVYHDRTWLGELKTEKQDVNDIKWKSVYHYALEDEETGRLFLLKVDDGDVHVDDILYVGERGGRISTYSKSQLGEATGAEESKSLSEDAAGVVVRAANPFKKLKAKSIIIAVIAFVGFLTPFLSTLMNFYLAFKHDYKSVMAEHPEVNTKLVRFVCGVCAVMPVFFTVKVMLLANILSLNTFISSSSTWGLVSGLFVVGGYIYVVSGKEKDIERLGRNTK